MRCGCILVGVAILLILAGIQGIREARAFSKPVEITAQQFMLSAPKEGWYKITGCELSIDESVYMVTTHRSSRTPDDSYTKDSASEQPGGDDGAEYTKKPPVLSAPPAPAETNRANKEKQKADNKAKPGDKDNPEEKASVDDQGKDEGQSDKNDMRAEERLSAIRTAQMTGTMQRLRGSIFRCTVSEPTMKKQNIILQPISSSRHVTGRCSKR